MIGGIRGPIKCGIFQAVAVKSCCRSEVACGCCGRNGMFPGVLNVVLEVGMRVIPASPVDLHREKGNHHWREYRTEAV